MYSFLTDMLSSKFGEHCSPSSSYIRIYLFACCLLNSTLLSSNHLIQIPSYFTMTLFSFDTKSYSGTTSIIFGTPSILGYIYYIYQLFLPIYYLFKGYNILLLPCPPHLSSILRRFCIEDDKLYV